MAWEEAAGYCRAIRIANIVVVAGTTAIDNAGEIIGRGDVYKQVIFILRKIELALREVDAELTDVVRTRTYLTNAELLVEIEVDAILED